MYEYIKGKVTLIYENQVILECFGIGYAIFVSLNTLSKIKQDDDIMIYIYEHIREEEMTLYGFFTKDERLIFKDLLSVSGIGPKVAMNILSKFTINELVKFVILKDEKALSSVPGIGKKTANRLILELKDKFKNMSFLEQMDTETDSLPDKNGVRDDGVAALMSLGFDYHQASQFVGKVYTSEISVEELIKKALAAGTRT